MSDLSVDRLRTEYLTDPLGIDVVAPRFSWELHSSERAVRQRSYRVLVASDPGLLRPGAADLWDPGDVSSHESIGIRYAGRSLGSREIAHWTVRVTDQAGDVTEPHGPARFELGLLSASDWQARWIAMPPVPFERDWYRPAPHVRTRFTVRGPVRRARVYASALGLYELHLNGSKVGDRWFTPGWTDYTQRVRYQAYDVTDRLRQGGNAIGLVLGDGWYCGHHSIQMQRQTWGPRPQGLLQLEVVYTDGTTDTVTTREDWRGAWGPILASDMLLGELYDARQELGDWASPGYDDSRWAPVEIGEGTTGRLVAEGADPCRVTTELEPVAVTTPDFHTHVFDLGQNMTGVVRLRVTGAEAGREIIMRHGEALNPDGTVYRSNLRRARSVDRYICRGGDEEVFEPRFTFHGFRYVEVENYPGSVEGESFGHPNRVPADAVTGLVIHSDMPVSGEFRCSDDLVNEIHRCALWSWRGNVVDVPTDCPQRNERMGWLGDARSFARTASFAYETAAFFTRWLETVLDARSPDGMYPDFAPVVGQRGGGAPGWADAGVMIPRLLLELYGDEGLVERHFDAMCAYVDLVLDSNPDGIWRERSGVNWGDWLSLPDDESDASSRSGVIASTHSTTPKHVFATAVLARTTEALSEMAAAVGRAEESARYAEASARVREAFRKAFVSPDGRIEGDTQTAHVLALRWDLVGDEHRRVAVDRLLADLERRDWHLSTGMTGTEHLLSVLAEEGHLDAAYRLLLQETYPGWGYTIRNGATTIWERWDGWTEERGFQDIRMNSFNHYALGSVGAWIYSTVGGISAGSPGYAHVVVRPRPGGGITWAESTYHSVRGPIAVAWRSFDDRFDLDVTVPANATASVWVPVSAGCAVTEGGQPIDDAAGVTGVRQEGEALVVEVGSGSYSFSARGSLTGSSRASVH